MSFYSDNLSFCSQPIGHVNSIVSVKSPIAHTSVYSKPLLKVEKGVGNLPSSLLSLLLPAGFLLRSSGGIREKVVC